MDTQRILRIRLPDDTDDFVEINTSIRDQESGRTFLVHDIAYGKYDVVMETGSNYATQRQEAADLQMELLKVLGPEKASNIVHLIVKNLGVPGSDEVARVLRKMLPDTLKSEEEKIADLPRGVTPDPENEGQFLKDGEPWQPPLTIDQQLAQKQQQIDELQAQADQAKHEATIATAGANKAQAEAKIETAKADMAKVQGEIQALQSGVGAADAGQVDGMMDKIEQVIQAAIKEHAAEMSEATEEQIADAVVEVLTRTRNYVDKQHASIASEVKELMIQ